MINLGSTAISDLKLGGAPVQAVYRGSQLVWSPPSGYFGGMSAQVYGWDRDFQVDWWGD
jgi:hypothetical protein